MIVVIVSSSNFSQSSQVGVIFTPPNQVLDTTVGDNLSDLAAFMKDPAQVHERARIQFGRFYNEIERFLYVDPTGASQAEPFHTQFNVLSLSLNQLKDIVPLLSFEITEDQLRFLIKVCTVFQERFTVIECFDPESLEIEDWVSLQHELVKRSANLRDAGLILNRSLTVDSLSQEEICLSILLSRSTKILPRLDMELSQSLSKDLVNYILSIKDELEDLVHMSALSFDPVLRLDIMDLSEIYSSAAHLLVEGRLSIFRDQSHQLAPRDLFKLKSYGKHFKISCQNLLNNIEA